MTAIFKLRLDLRSGVPAYRQIIDQVLGGMASGMFKPGDQLPTVRQLAVDLQVNPNTVVRAYRELEIRGVLETHQGTGTFIGDKKLKQSEVERQRRLDQIAGECMAKAGAEGFSASDLVERMTELYLEKDRKGERK